MKDRQRFTDADELLLDLYLESFEHMPDESVDEELRLRNIDPREEPRWRRKVLDSLAADLADLNANKRPALFKMAAAESQVATPELNTAIFLDAGDLQFRYSPGVPPTMSVTGAVPQGATRLVFSFEERAYSLRKADEGWTVEGLTRRVLATYRKQNGKRPARDLFRFE